MDTLIVHDDSMFSRVAYLLEERKKNIRLYEKILRGEDVPKEYLRVNIELVKKQLELERWALSDLLEDIEDGLLWQELKDVERDYVITSREGQ